MQGEWENTILFKSSILTFDSLYKRLFNRRNDFVYER